MLGRKLRDTRRNRNLTLRDVAEGAGVSEGHLSKVENDKVAPSLPVLHRVAAVLGINLARLFENGGGDPAAVARAGERPLITLDPLRRGTGVTLERVIAYAPEHQLQCNIHIMEPGGASDGQISHRGEEVGIVLEGEIDLLLGGEVHRLHAGDTFHFDSELAHGYRNAGATRARIFWVNTPPTF